MCRRLRPCSSKLQPFILSKQLRDLRIDLLLFGEIRNTVAPPYELLDLLLDLFLLRLRHSALTDVVFIVHRPILQLTAKSLSLIIYRLPPLHVI